MIKKTGSAAIKSDSLHYQVDLLTNGAVVFALVGAYLGYYQLDNIFALLIGCYMLYSVKNLAWEAIQTLMDQSLPETDLQEIERRALAIEGIKGVHEIRTRVSGTVPLIQMHLDVDGALTLKEAHEIGYNAKLSVLEYLPKADVMIHLDPEG